MDKLITHKPAGYRDITLILKVKDKSPDIITYQTFIIHHPSLIIESPTLFSFFNRLHSMMRFLSAIVCSAVVSPSDAFAPSINGAIKSLTSLQMASDNDEVILNRYSR